MTPEERSLLERTHKLAEENNEILRSMRRISRISGAFRLFYWLVIIGVSVGAFYVIQPYVETIFGLYKGATSAIGDNMSTAQNITNTLNDLLSAPK